MTDHSTHGGEEPHDHLDDEVELDEDEVIERAVLNDSEEGRAIAAAFVAEFGSFVSETVRPVLRQVALDGGRPQLLVNGLAELMRQVADSIEMPIDADRAG